MKNTIGNAIERAIAIIGITFVSITWTMLVYHLITEGISPHVSFGIMG